VPRLRPIIVSPHLDEPRRAELEAQARRDIAGYVLLSLAGVAAQAIRAEVDVWPHARKTDVWREDDCHRAETELQRLWGMLPERTRPLDIAGRVNALYSGLRLVHRLLLPHRAVLYALADALMQREKLRRPQIEALILKHGRQLDGAQSLDPARLFLPCIDV
jgi:hypothetical protein